MNIDYLRNRTKELLASRAMVIVIACTALAISLSFSSLGWMYDDLFHRLVMRNTTAVKDYVPEKFSFDPLAGYYVFLDGDTERTHFLKDRGLVPWWANDDTSVAFWRPLSSFTFLLDFTLWPENPVLFHHHNGLWFIALAIAAFLLYRRLLKPHWLAGLAGLMFVANGINLMPVAWIANRHTLVALAFGLCSLLFLDRHHDPDKSRAGSLFLSCLFFALALLASELGIIVFAYLTSHILFLSGHSAKKKCATVVPFLVIIVAWRIVYTLLGFGVRGSEIYVDPIHNPIEFLSGIPTRAPFILANALLGIPADIYGYFSANALPAASVVIFIIVCVAGIVIRPARMKNRSLYFWIGCIAFTLVPLCASSPAERHLAIISFGTVGLLMQLLVSYTESRNVSGQKKRIGQAVVLSVILTVKLISGIVGVILLPVTLNATRNYIEGFLDFGTDPKLQNRDIVIVSPPIIHFVYSLAVERLFNDLPMPGHIRIISPPFSGVTLLRLDRNSINVDVDNGYYPPPSLSALPPSPALASFLPFPLPDFFNPVYSFLRLDRIFIDSSYHPLLGDTIRLSRVTITVTGLTRDGRIRGALFEFDVPLEDPSLELITWDPEKEKYKPFPIPEIGQVVRLERPGN